MIVLIPEQPSSAPDYMDNNQQFLYLAARVLSAHASAEEQAILEKFMREDAGLRRRFDLIKSYWENKTETGADLDDAFRKTMDKIDRHGESIQRDESVADTLMPPKRAVVKKLTRFYAAAAVCAVLVVGATLFLLNTPQNSSGTREAVVAWKTRENPKGARSSIVLADGTRVILNADSRLRFPENFDADQREVFLTGEAFFDVTHNADRPFIIHAGKMHIRVLGTEFNVRSYPGDSTSEATLIRGLIEVTLADRPDDKIILKPTEKLIVSNDVVIKGSTGHAPALAAKAAQLTVGNLHYVSPTDSAVLETLWIDNRLAFHDQAFSSLATDLERKYNVVIEFQNKAIKNLRFTGVFENESIRDVMEALRLTESFNYRIDNRRIIIY